MLATPATAGAELDGPYDVSVVDPILLSAEGHADDELREEAERWADRASFEVGDVVDPVSFPVEVTLDDVDIGDLQITVTIDADGKVVLEIAAPGNASDELLAARRAALRRDWLTIRYESGHTVTGGQGFSTRFQDRIFDDLIWEDFDVNGRNFDVKKEKPNTPNSTAFDPAAIGNAGERSLFSWILAHWRDPAGQEGTGWLASDDGAGEIADFIHIDESGDVPMLCLIHVKGSKSDTQNRGISTSDYEVVVGQAIKNLRFLDLDNLANQLEAGKNKQVAQANWHDSVQQDDERDPLVEAIGQLGTNTDVQIVVVQPRVTQNEHDGARGDAANGNVSSRVKRLRQLDALLLEAQAACQALGARFVVVGDAQGNP